MVVGLIMFIVTLLFMLAMAKMAISTKCNHKWVKVDERTGPGTATTIIMQCEHCGKVKTVRI